MNDMRCGAATLLLSVICLATGCSTVVNRRYQAVPVSTFPPAATLAVACGGIAHFEAATPATVPVNRRAVPCEIRASRAGHETATVSLRRRVSRAFWANLMWAASLTVIGYAADEESDGAVWGLALSTLGMAIDASTGAMFTREPKDIEIVLPPLEPQRADEEAEQ